MKIELFYDKDCPFCNSYAKYIKLKQIHELIILNAREELSTINEFRNIGFDINDGFIIRVDNKKIYQGSDAIIYLNTISSKKIYFPNNFFFRKIIYTFVKEIRKVLLFLLKRNHKI